jgi:exonuclease SbcC
MSDLFLSRIRLSDFRVYGDHYTFDLDPRPGVTLIVGVNGVGKTTMFDGIEWALTGSVSRFNDMPLDGRRRERNPLTRLGRPEGAHRVSLQFSEGQPIDRGQGLEPTKANIIGLLQQSDWPEIGDLGRYLSITHFLGQAASQRFSVRNPRAQWEALKGPAGVDRINFVKERIGGQAARRAFNRVVEESSARLTAARKALEDWEALLAERDRMAQLASSEEAVNPADIAAAANDVASRLQALGLNRDWSIASDAEPAEGVLNRLLAHLIAAEEQFRGERTHLEELQARANTHAQASAEAAATTQLVREFQTRHDASVTAVAQAEAAATEAEARLPMAVQRAADARAQITLLSRATSARDQLVAAETALSADDMALAASDATTRAASSRQSELIQLISDTAALLDLRGRLTEQLAQAEQRVDLAARWATADADVVHLEAALGQLDVEGLRARRVQLVERREAQRGEITALSDELRARDERQAALAQAVAEIAARLTEADLHCPICATTFQPGELLHHASARRAHYEPTAEDLANRLAAKRLDEAATIEALRGVNESLTKHTQLLDHRAIARATAAGLLQQLAEAGAPGGAPSAAALAAQLLALRTQLANVTRQISASLTLDELRAETAQISATLDAEAARRANLTRRRADALSQAESARSVLRQSPALWTDTEGFRVNLENAQAAAEREMGSASQVFEAVQREIERGRLTVDSARQKLTADTVALERANRRLNVATEQRDAQANAWRNSGMSGDPDPLRLESALSAAISQLRATATLSERQRQLTAGYRRWTQDETLRAIERRIKEQSVGAAPQARTQQLRADVDDATADLDRAQAVRGRMDRLVSQMQSKADDYAGQVLEPLNDTIRAFSRALMTWSDAAIVYKAEFFATRAELRPKAVRTEPDGQITDLDINPNYYFSEGQLSALSVSALLAASTSFRWSRWRALLMDDPLQHNDVIHASAFMDQMRQLVRLLGYQVIMSTHDSAEAEFLVRKCESIGIPHRVHELAPSGDNGLVSDAA